MDYIILNKLTLSDSEAKLFLLPLCSLAQVLFIFKRRARVQIRVMVRQFQGVRLSAEVHVSLG